MFTVDAPLPSLPLRLRCFFFLLKRYVHSLHCQSAVSMDVHRVDPSLALAFYLPDRAAFKDLVKRMGEVRRLKTRMVPLSEWTLGQGRVSIWSSFAANTRYISCRLNPPPPSRARIPVPPRPHVPAAEPPPQTKSPPFSVEQTRPDYEGEMGLAFMINQRDDDGTTDDDDDEYVFVKGPER